VTENISDPVPLATAALSCPLQLVANREIKGFGANHNAAFTHCRTPFYCVCNPDVRLTGDPFAPLLESLSRTSAAAAGPLVRSPSGGAEDSARRFPTVGSLLRKAFTGRAGPDYPTDRGPLEVDWIAGMFMLFRAEAYRAVGGFDEAYFLYYEDIEICRRLRRSGKRVIYDPRAQVIHDARRASRRDPRLARHHIASALRFLADR
jgi:GT2 family glycosyltransferase